MSHDLGESQRQTSKPSRCVRRKLPECSRRTCSSLAASSNGASTAASCAPSGSVSYK